MRNEGKGEEMREKGGKRVKKRGKEGKEKGVRVVYKNISERRWTGRGDRSEGNDDKQDY